MRITSDEVSRYGLNIKRWLGEMQLASREVGAPTFALKGPVSLQVRYRRGTGPTAVTTRSKAFLGGEVFRVSGLAADYQNTSDTYFLSVSLAPANTQLAGEISGMTLTLLECVTMLEGFEEWMAAFESAKYAELSKKPPSIKEVHEANPVWGSW